MHTLSATITLPLSVETAFRVITDLNTLLRLSPFFTLIKFKSSMGGPLRKGHRYTVTIEYYGNEAVKTHCIEVDAFEMNRSISYRIEEGALKNILYEIVPHEGGIQLTQTFLLQSGDEAVVKGSQSELQFWIKSTGEYLKLTEGKSFFTRLQRRFMDRVWLRLTLSERNIAIIMAKISILEIVLLLVVVLIWNLGMGR
ncbi:MAG: SRPBCC family protein [Thermoleophilia bacterium]